MAKPRRRALKKKAGPTLLDLIPKNRRVLAVLDKHGVSFCAGCFLTFSSSLEKVAAYHAVPDHEKFIAELLKAAKKR